MKLIPYSVHTGEENMQIDSDLLDEAIQNQSQEPVFRLYGWKPMCISLGRNQRGKYFWGKYQECKSNNKNIDCVRRLTGGRALLHDDEVTYSFVAPISIIPNGETVIESYKYISGILIKFFKTLGIDLDFGENKKISTHFDYCMLLSTGADVCYNGQKIIGSAQYRKEGYVLQHGSILFSYDKALLEELFNEEVKGIISVSEVLPSISKEVLIQELEHFLSQL